MNYQAYIFEYDKKKEERHPKPEIEKLAIYSFGGEDVIVNKTMYLDGDICFYFSAGTELADWFLTENRLYRKHPVTGEKMEGFFEKNGWVKTIKLHGAYSRGFILKVPQKYLDQVRNWTNDTMDYLLTDGEHKQFCYKAVSRTTHEQTFKEHTQNEPKHRDKWIFELPLHRDTEMLYLGLDKIPPGAVVHITKKDHGTSARTGLYEVINLNRRWWEKFGEGWNPFYKPEYVDSYQTGTRKVDIIESSTNYNISPDHYRTFWHEVLMERGLYYGEAIFYEIVGRYIQPGHGEYIYHYDADGKGYNDETIYVYKILQTDQQGFVHQLSYFDTIRRCNELKLNCVMWFGTLSINSDEDKKTLVKEIKKLCSIYQYHDPIGGEGHIMEGVVVMVEHPTFAYPKFYKFKSDAFSELEGISLQSERFIDIQ